MGAAASRQLQGCPVGTRLLAALYAATSGGVALLGTQGMRSAQLHFICSLSTVVRSRYYWGALTSALYRPLQDALDIIMTTIEVYFSSEFLADKERELGTTRYLVWAVVTTGCVNAVFLAMMRSLAASNNPRAQFFTNQGLWSLVTVCMTLQAMERPDQLVKVLGVAEVPARWYPLSMAIGLSAARGVMQWDMLAGIVVGHAYKLWALEGILLPSRRLASKLERRWLRPLPGLLGSILGGRWVMADGLPPADDRPLAAPASRGGRGRGRGRIVFVVEPEGGSGEGGDGSEGGGGAGGGFRLFGGPGRRLGD